MEKYQKKLEEIVEEFTSNLQFINNMYGHEMDQNDLNDLNAFIKNIENSINVGAIQRILAINPIYCVECGKESEVNKDDNCAECVQKIQMWELEDYMDSQPPDHSSESPGFGYNEDGGFQL